MTALFMVLVRDTTAAAQTVRFATFNASLTRDESGALLEDLANPNATDANVDISNRIRQVHDVAEILQRMNADVVLINEFDFDCHGTPTASSAPTPLGYSSHAANQFHEGFLAVAHGGGDSGRSRTEPLTYPYRYTPNTNTGLPTGLDLDRDNAAGGRGDSYGFGGFPGQYGLTVYSKLRIKRVRSFQTFRWKDMPGNLLTEDPTLGDRNLSQYYSTAAMTTLRLSSKNHVDLVLDLDGQEVHFLVSHPTPPVFDGPEDRNGKRNHDELRFWQDYIHGASYIYDDQGVYGGLPEDARFVLAGDFNADPHDGESLQTAIGRLLSDPRVNASCAPGSQGALEAATWPANNGAANQSHHGDPRLDTADFDDRGPGNLRVDYVLPSANLPIKASGVFWPASADPAFVLVGTYRNPDFHAGFASSDHRAIWVDIDFHASSAGGSQTLRD